MHQWLAVYPILTAMVIYTGAIHLDPDRLMQAGSFLAFTSPSPTWWRRSWPWATPRRPARSAAALRADQADPRGEPEFPAAVIEPVRLGGALALERVSFRYPGQDPGDARCSTT